MSLYYYAQLRQNCLRRAKELFQQGNYITAIILTHKAETYGFEAIKLKQKEADKDLQKYIAKVEES